MQKNWMTFVETLRPSSRRRDEARRRRRPSRYESATAAPEFHPPYDHQMSDRFRPMLSTR